MALFNNNNNNNGYCLEPVGPSLKGLNSYLVSHFQKGYDNHWLMGSKGLLMTYPFCEKGICIHLMGHTFEDFRVL